MQRLWYRANSRKLSFLYRRWSIWDNQPNNHGGNQDHLIFNFAFPHVPAGQWDDENKNQKFSYICQYRPKKFSKLTKPLEKIWL